MRIILAYIVVVCNLLPFALRSQETKIYMRSEGNGIVELKWFSPTIVSTEGFNVYRKTGNGNWQKLNQEPLKLGVVDLPNSATPEEKELVELFSNPNFTWGQDQFLTVILLQRIIKSENVSRSLGIQFKDNTASGTALVYKITEIKSGNEVELVQSESVNPNNKFYAPAPQGLVTKEKRKKISIGWKPESELYFAVNVYRRISGTNNWLKINEEPVIYTGSSTQNDRAVYQFIDEEIEEGASYDYKLVSIDYFGKEAGETSSLVLASKDDTPPLPVEDLKFDVDEKDQSVVLSWVAPQSADLQSFTVYLSQANDTTLHVLRKKIPKDSNYLFVKLNQSGYYNCSITAVDTAGNESEPSASGFNMEDKIPPHAPQNVLVQADSGIVSIIWKPNNEADLLGYYVYRKNESDDDFIRVSANPQDTSFFIEKFAPHLVASLQYMVVALDTSGNHSAGSELASIKFLDKNPPPVPQITHVRYDSGRVTVNWLPSDCNDLKEYILFKMNETDSTWKRLNKTSIQPFATRFTDRFVDNGETYWYKIMAIDTIGNKSEFSILRKIKIPLAWQSPQVESFKAIAKKKSGQVRVEWQSDKPENVLAYTLLQSNDGKTWLPLTGAIKETSYSYKSQPGEYWIKLKLVDLKGIKSSSEPIKILVEEKK